MINPTFVEGQMHGAVAMGVGAALMEELATTREGHLLTDRFKRYLMPRASDVPRIEIEHQVTPSPFTLLGVKGAGEAGVGGRRRRSSTPSTTRSRRSASRSRRRRSRRRTC